MPRKEMTPALKDIIDNHKPRHLSFAPLKPKTLEEEFGPDAAARIRRGAKLAQLGDPKEKPDS